MRVLIASLVLLPLFTLGQATYHIKAKVDQLVDSTKVYLVYKGDDQQITDSAFVRMGKFSFKGSLEYPVLAELFLNHNPYIEKDKNTGLLDKLIFYLEPVVMEMNSTDSLKNISINGSPTNDHHSILREMQAETNRKYDALSEEISALPPEKLNDTSIYNTLVKRELAIMNETYEVQLDFCNKYPESYLSLICLGFIAPHADFYEKVKTSYDKLPEELRKSPLGQDVLVLLASHNKTKIGQIAPDFAQQTPKGDTVKLSDFRGKYLLLDFWASWCGPCRADNPNLVKTYDQYKDKGFEILGVSMDNPGQRDAWLKAIEADGLTWPQVSDLRGWKNKVAVLYGITMIPANFLLDPDGKIIARDLRGQAIMDKLDVIFVDNGK